MDKVRTHLKAMKASLSNHFPKGCGCGRTFQDEHEYNTRTVAIGNPINALDYGMGFLFYRNCQCNSTIVLNLNPQDFSEDHRPQFMDYLDNRVNSLIEMSLRAKSELSPTGEYTLDNKSLEILRASCLTNVMHYLREEYNTYLHEHPETGNSDLTEKVHS